MTLCGLEHEFPVELVFGRACVKNNAERLSLGKKAFIVCGKSSAVLSGALHDVTEVLERLGTEYTLFDRSVENPPVLLCHEGGEMCRKSRADFVIGIGGGSAIDAAKAVAVFAADAELDALDIFDMTKRRRSPLPLIAVPTTSGTGSEANGTAVMSLPDGMQKRSFSTDFPKISFIDPIYTCSLGYKPSLSCALDAFAHSAESYLSPRADNTSRLLSVYAAEKIISVLKRADDAFTYEDREQLQLAATAAGLAISVTGTGFPHPLGYSLTMLDGIPHGSACAVFYRQYIEYNRQSELGNKLICDFCNKIGSTPEELAVLIPSLSGVKLEMTDENIEKHVSLVRDAKNYLNSPYILSNAEKNEIYRELFSASRK